MGIFDTLFGRSKPVPSKSEALFAISTAQITLQTKLQLTPSTRAGIVFRPVDSGYFVEAEQQVQGMLQQSGKDDNLRFETQTDSYGFRWIILKHDTFEELVAAMHMISLTLTDQRFGDQLLAGVFRFDSATRPVYWIYNYKRGTFYPFVPVGSRQERDNAEELKLGSVMKGELPIEKATDRWYPIWGIPF